MTKKQVWSSYCMPLYTQIFHVRFQNLKYFSGSAGQLSYNQPALPFRIFSLMEDMRFQTKALVREHDQTQMRSQI